MSLKSAGLLPLVRLHKAHCLLQMRRVVPLLEQQRKKEIWLKTGVSFDYSKVIMTDPFSTA